METKNPIVDVEVSERVYKCRLNPVCPMLAITSHAMIARLDC